MSHTEINELRKAGKTDEAYRLAHRLMEEAPEDQYVRSAFGWVLYDLLKRIAEHPAELPTFISLLGELRELAPDPEDEYGARLLDLCRTLIAKMASALKEDPKKPPQQLSSELDSLFEAIRELPLLGTIPYRGYFIKSFADKRWHSVPEFADWVGWEHLDNSEYRPEEYNEHNLPSACDTLISAVSQQLLSQGVTDRMRAWIPRLKALAEGRGAGFRFLRYYVTQMMLQVGGCDKEELLSFYKPFARSKERNSWVWELMGDIYAHFGEVPKQLACYCKGLMQPGEEEFKVGLHRKVAKILARNNRLPEAATEIDLVLRVYRLKGWSRPPRELVEMSKQPWFTSVEHPKDNHELYRQYEEYLEKQTGLPKSAEATDYVFVISDYNPKTETYTFVTQGKDCWGRFKSWKSLVVGEVYQGTIITKNSSGGFARVSKIKKLNRSDYPQLAKEVEGRVHLVEGFGFLGKEIFISGKLIQEEGLVDGMTCRALVTPSYNRKKKEWGLVACRILSKGQPD